MEHRRVRLNEFGRGLLVHRVIEEGWSAAAAAEASGVSRATVYKWLGRYEAEGWAGLADRSCVHIAAQLGFRGGWSNG